MLIDCLGTWLSRTIDGWGVWEKPFEQWRHRFDGALMDFLDAWHGSSQLTIAVTNEVGWGLVSEYRAGRLFADHLGRVNARVADACDDVTLLVAGRPVDLTAKECP